MGQTLTLDISAVADAEGLTNASYTYLYQWLRNGAEIPEATDTSYTLVDADEGKTMKVKVSFTDDANNAESRTSAPTGGGCAPAKQPADGGAHHQRDPPGAPDTVGRHIGALPTPTAWKPPSSDTSGSPTLAPPRWNSTERIARPTH